MELMLFKVIRQLFLLNRRGSVGVQGLSNNQALSKL